MFDEEATRPKSGLTDQQVTSPRCPLITCIGPSIRRLFVSDRLLVPLVLPDRGLRGVVGVVVGGSGPFFLCE